MLHILICPFGSLDKNIMPLPGTTRGRKRKEFGDVGIERKVGRDSQGKG